MTAADLAKAVEPRLDAFTFTFQLLHEELEAIETGAGAYTHEVLQCLPSHWQDLGWKMVRFDAEADRP